MKVATWADGFGNWHALVTQKGVADWALAEAAAREAIVAELKVREANFDPSRMSLRVVDRSSRDGELRTEFVEEWPN